MSYYQIGELEREDEDFAFEGGETFIYDVTTAIVVDIVTSQEPFF